MRPKGRRFAPASDNSAGSRRPYTGCSDRPHKPNRDRGDCASERGEAPVSRWGVGFGTAGAVSQRLADDIVMSAFAAICCRSMAR